MYAEESYYGRRPRFLSGDDIASLISGGTGQTVDTINRTGEQIAKASGDTARNFGKGIRDTVQNWYQGKRDKFERDELTKQAKRAEESHSSAMKLSNENLEAARLANQAAQAEEHWMNEPYLAPGAMGPLPEHGHKGAANNRSALLQDKLDELVRRTEAHKLGLRQSEEGILASKATRAAAAAQAAAARTLLQRESKDREEARFLQDLISGGTMDSQSIQQQTSTSGPPVAANHNVSRVLETAASRGIDPLRAQTLYEQARGLIASNLKQQGTIDRNVEPAGAALQDSIIELQKKAPELAGLINDLGAVTSFGDLNDLSPNSRAAYAKFLTGLKQIDPQGGEILASTVPRSFFFQPENAFTDGSILTGRNSAAKAAVSQLIGDMKAKATAALEQARARGDYAGSQLAQSADNVLEQLEVYERNLGLGVGGSNHNLPPPQRQFFEGSQQRQQQTPRGGTTGRPVRYDGRG